MLFAVEGGGFFSASASGYSKGLALLLFGQKDKEKLMRVIPLNPYHLVDHEIINHETKLDTGNIWPVRRCDCFVCFGCAVAGHESPSTLKVDTAQNQEILTENPDFTERKDQAHLIDEVNGDSEMEITCLRSILKKSSYGTPVATSGCGEQENINEVEASCGKGNKISCEVGGKVQWTDKIGGELFEIREFEMSEDDSDDELDYRSKKTCSCWIMS